MTTDLETHLTAVLAGMTLQQKVRLLTGTDFWSVGPDPAIGLCRVVFSDGPAGVRGERWDEREPSVNVPSPTALAATWDESTVEEVGRLLAAEARDKGVDVLLAPVVNLHRTPYGGRHFECFSEDPALTARVAGAFVRGVQSGGVAATVKHLVGNDTETDRMSVDVRMDERTLRELYLAPFEALLSGDGAWAVMAAYNSVNGTPMTEHPLLASVVKGEWGFDGVVMSDWFATRSTVPAASGGLDLAMPGPHSPWGDALVAAVEAGDVPEATVDDKVRRILRLAARVGALAGAPPVAERPRFDQAGTARVLRETAVRGFVLTDNDGLLPLDAAALRTVAVIGPNAEHGRTLGGGSATVFPPYTVSPLEGLRAALGEQVRVTHHVGVRAHTRVPAVRPGWLQRPGGGDGVEVRFLDAAGTVLAAEHRSGASLTWLGSFGPDLPGDRIATVEVRARLRSGPKGRYTLGVSGLGHYRMEVDGSELFDTTIVLQPGADLVDGIMLPPQHSGYVDLDAEVSADIRLVHDVTTSAPFGTVFHVNVEPPVDGDDIAIACAVSAAREADAVVLVVGTTEEAEREGVDRSSLRLPGRQDDLVSAVTAANPRTVVVVNAGAPVLMPWARDAAAVLLTWFPGQEYGHALADVLCGIAEPGGRLPTTWPADEVGLPAPRPVAGTLVYGEGFGVGYRSDERRAHGGYPFGHGLGYTTWTAESISLPPEAQTGADVTVRVRVRNTGQRHGRQVVQLYLSRPDGEVARPARWLAAFTTVEAAPGESVDAEAQVPARAFTHWDARHGGWRVEPGQFRLEIGWSSRDLGVGAWLTVA